MVDLDRLHYAAEEVEPEARLHGHREWLEALLADTAFQPRAP